MRAFRRWPKGLMLWMVLLELLGASSLDASAEETPPASREVVARRLAEQLVAGEFAKAAAPFDATMRAGLPPKVLEQVWKAQLSLYGPLKKLEETRGESIGAYRVIYVPAHCERGLFEIKVVFDGEDRVAGLFFLAVGKYETPAYVQPDRLEESDVSVGDGLFPLAGTLTLPKMEGKVPAVVLVHGSGPGDRDESVGPNKPFRDLAGGLASRGIAVLRYEKRTRSYGAALALAPGWITVKEETIDDAVAAVRIAAGHPRIDSARVFVLGHSQGGMLIPRIAAADAKASGKPEGRVAGFISLAGSARPLEDSFLAQVRYLLPLSGQSEAEQRKQLTEAEQQVARVKSPDLSPATPAASLPLGVPAHYWLDLRSYDPAAAARSLDRPLLFLQGERDYQVTLDDLARWKKSLDGRAHVKFQTYPKLNHLFMEGTGQSTPAEYFRPQHVAEYVIADLADWIRSVR